MLFGMFVFLPRKGLAKIYFKRAQEYKITAKNDNNDISDIRYSMDSNTISGSSDSSDIKKVK